MWNNRNLIVILILAFMPTLAHPAPTITYISGTVLDNSSITIRGVGFGANGPNILFFDDFEGGTVGQNIRTGVGSATIGKWSSIGIDEPYYSNDTAVSGSKAFKAVTKEGSESHANGFISLPNVTETFISWWCYVPSNSPWSGEEDNNVVNWKIIWLYEDNSSYDSLYLAQQKPDNGALIYHVGGNGSTLGYPTDEYWRSTSLVKGAWHRYWMWVQDGYSTDGKIKIWELTPNGPVQNKDASNITTLHAGIVRRTLSVNGYTRRMYTTQATQMFDDVYVATGPNAQARIEMGTGCTGGDYTKCTNLAVSTINSWSDGIITATARLGNLSGTTIHIFVIDAGGVASQGYPVPFENVIPKIPYFPKIKDIK
jgi:hypothetical protein